MSAARLRHMLSSFSPNVDLVYLEGCAPWLALSVIAPIQETTEAEEAAPAGSISEGAATQNAAPADTQTEVLEAESCSSAHAEAQVSREDFALAAGELAEALALTCDLEELQQVGGAWSMQSVQTLAMPSMQRWQPVVKSVKLARA